MNIVEKYNLNITEYNLDKYLGVGADGCAYLSGDKVIKFTHMFDNKKHLLNNYNKNKRLIEKIIVDSPKHFVKTIDFKFLKDFEKDNNYHIIYYYVMEKLEKLSDDEVRVFHTLLSHEDSNKVKNHSDYYINKTISNLSQFLDFDKEKVINFINQIKKYKIQHSDVHPRNIMKDNLGNFKFIDLDRLKETK